MVGFWYGAKLFREGEYSTGQVFTVSEKRMVHSNCLLKINPYIQVFFAIVNGIFNLGQAGPHFQALTQAQAAAFIVWQVIDAVGGSKCALPMQTESHVFCIR